MSIGKLHEDIIQTHILTKLDGQSLAAVACTSSQLHSLCTHRNLWSAVCSSTWPSTDDPLLRRTISHFPSGHRSFFSDSFPSPCHRLTTTAAASTAATTHLISAVDLRYDGELVFSKVESTDTTPNDWFQSSPFRIDLLEPKETVPAPVKFSGDDESLHINLENHMTLSWIVIDTAQNRSVNLSSTKPVSVKRNWLTGNVHVRFAVVVAVDGGAGDGGTVHEYVNCNIEATCRLNGSEELHVGGLSLTFQDMDGKSLSGRESMVILDGVMREKRCKKRGEREGRERYEEYVRRRRERKEKKEMRERRLDMVCVASGVAMVMAFWSFALY